jgi:hypothetical protein
LDEPRIPTAAIPVAVAIRPIAITAKNPGRDEYRRFDRGESGFGPAISDG